MKPFELDNNGIPILSRIDIEERAEQFIEFFDKKCCIQPRFTPLHIIVERLKEEYGVRFVLEADLGNSPEGYKYRGRFHIPSTTILIDKSLPMGEPRFNFTLAHEIAHFVLHRKINRSVIKKEKEQEISDTNRQLILDQIQNDNPRDWLEWQANKFASSLLLPRSTVPLAVTNKQKEMGITRRIGTIFHDNQPKNRSDYHEIMGHLVNIFITSKSAIRLRLRELDILIETNSADILANHGSEPIGNILVGVFDSIAEKYK